MSDENNTEKLMEQFIKKASPKLLDSMSQQIEQIVEDRISGLVKKNEELLDEVKDAKREREAAATKQAEDLGQLKTLLERGGSAPQINASLNLEPIKITRAQARDVSLYRRAKAQAEQNGTTIQVVEE